MGLKVVMMILGLIKLPLWAATRHALTYEWPSISSSTADLVHQFVAAKAGGAYCTVFRQRHAWTKLAISARDDLFKKIVLWVRSKYSFILV